MVSLKLSETFWACKTILRVQCSLPEILFFMSFQDKKWLTTLQNFETQLVGTKNYHYLTEHGFEK